MSGKPNKFFLGKTYDLEKSEMQETPVYYDPGDLTTHAVITGMTGSGKTGLGIIMLEEAALRGIPAIVVDPKGDLTNLLLHFPDLLPSDFEPWVDHDEARRQGITDHEAAEKAASLWKNGLASYGIGKPELEALRDAVDYAVYTPGSDAGLPVSILASLAAPTIPWEGNREILREKISSTVTALLGLVGVRDIDPVRTREHILLSNIFESAWQQGRDLDMETLITHVQSPPFDKLGVLSMDQFYPERDRFALAMLLNNFLAAPAFHIWLEGQPLDIGQILYTPEGKPRHSVFYLAHLNDQERMFFITLLYTSIETWMRMQKGSSSLKAIVYFDEIAGYLPPVANPPSKTIILRMLKQARAFGVGLMVATQNPVDLDYKALSNAGTWLIGRLQTEQDKARLLDGLEGAAPGIDRRAFDRMISLIDKRVFLLHNVHDDAAQVFHTRWAMNYLPGPLTRAQIPELNAMVEAQSHGAAKHISADGEKAEKKTGSRLGQDVPPVISGSVKVHYLPVSLGPGEAVRAAGKGFDVDLTQPQYLYKPALTGQARVAYLARSRNISQEKVYSVRVDELQRRGLVRWENFLTEPIDLDRLVSTPRPDGVFENFDNLAIDDAKFVGSLEADFVDWIYRTQTMTVRVNNALDVVAGPDLSDEDFRRQCADAVEGKLAADIASIKDRFAKRRESLEDKLRTETQRYDKEKQQLNHRRMEEVGKGLENVLGLVIGSRRSLSTSLTKRRITSQTKANVDAREENIKEIESDIKRLDSDLEKEIEEAKKRWEAAVEDVVEEAVSPYKKNIFVELFGLLWLPYYAFPQGDNWMIVPAFDWEAVG